MKNILGAFHQPAAVFCDTGLLKGLPRRERVSGLAEAVKCGLIWGPPLLTRIRRDWSRLLRGDASALTAVVSRCAAGKAAVVSRDFRETRGRRESLNFGHTKKV